MTPTRRPRPATTIRRRSAVILAFVAAFSTNLHISPRGPRTSKGFPQLVADAARQSTQEDATIRDGGVAGSAGATTCSPSDGACRSGPSASSCGAEKCRVGTDQKASPSLYDRGGGGSARAYRPDAPAKSVVCSSSEDSSGGRAYRVASWPLRRTSLGKGEAPSIKFTGAILSCGDGGATGDGCCCSSLSTAAGGVDATEVRVEVWQARPDGSYSSLRPGGDSGGDCRATVPVRSSSSDATTTFSFDTIHPGSTGALGGLGPNGFDLPPYGPPSIHFLVTAKGYVPLLVELELDGNGFSGPDFRGPALVGANKGKVRTSGFGDNHDDTAPMELTKVQTNEHGALEIKAKFYLDSLNKERTTEGVTSDGTSQKEVMCPSWLYGLPRSFFMEPIAVCAPTLLDFFRL